MRGIRVNAVAPGPVDTAMAKAVHSAAIRADYHDAIPLGRYGLEEEIAEAVFFLCSSARATSPARCSRSTAASTPSASACRRSARTRRATWTERRRNSPNHVAGGPEVVYSGARNCRVHPASGRSRAMPPDAALRSSPVRVAFSANGRPFRIEVQAPDGRAGWTSCCPRCARSMQLQLVDATVARHGRSRGRAHFVPEGLLRLLPCAAGAGHAA